MPGYVYKGTHKGPDLFDPVPKRKREPSPCGTKTAYKRHRQLKETPCGPCVEAMQPHFKPCGTYAAARRHERAGEPICEPCRKALREYRAKESRERRRI